MQKLYTQLIFKLLLSIIFIHSFNMNLFAQDSTETDTADSTDNTVYTMISGFVTGDKDSVLRGANLVISGSIDGATTDDKGYYEFETDKTGPQLMLVTFLDYAKKSVQLDIVAGININADIKLRKEEVRTEEILVTASSFTSGNNAAVTLTPLEIVRIPGADADIYRAITTFPGSNQVNEGSRITVRGGNPDEVLTILDLASLYHPFLFDETFNVSSYSTVNPWGLRGINFTSGGFSAKYGNVLSAVLDLKSYDMPQGTGMFAWLGLANASLDGTYVSKNKDFGATFSLGRLFLQPYFAVNGEHSDYSPIPESNQFGGTLAYKLGSAGNVKFIANYSDDKVGIFNASPSYEGYYNGSSKSAFSNLKVMVAPTSTTLLNAGVSFSYYEKFDNYGVLNTTSKSYYSKGRADYTIQVNSKVDINTGAEYEYDGFDINGIVPVYQYNLKPDAQSFNLDQFYSTGRIGVYAEAQLKLSKKVFVIPGVRLDNHTLSKETSFDPRFSFGYQVSNNNSVRGAIGVYHQYPDMQNYFNTAENNLLPEQAIHYILGYEFNKDGKYIARIEGYYKDYSNLVLINRDDIYYRSEGEGFAKGIDVFLKAKIANKFTGWISYAYSNSQRKQYSATSLVPANYDITNSLSIVGSYNLTDFLVLGATFKASTGKPYTPVVGTNFIQQQEVYEPIYGQTNSARFPTYDRVDMNLQYIFALFGKFAVAVASVNNILNQKNAYSYTYNADYTQQSAVISNNQRSLYLGLGLQF